MIHDWHELTTMTKGSPLIVERIKIQNKNIMIEGSFELPPLAQLDMEDQIFIIAFIRCHGSIKEMEEMFGVSYPTVKNRLNRIAKRLEFVEINPPASQVEILDQLAQGNINVDQTIEKLRGE
ncbi:MAG: RNA polymerase subunit sigma-70 [Spirochaetes bacterium DG_61]|jgi:hypothetical protein|nr:MAG: RNA polymerase subunit sigma-70 [Spirochaetes bacterium DG_61]